MVLKLLERYRRLAQPGDTKWSYIAGEHGGWLPMDGRTLQKAEYPILFQNCGWTSSSIVLPNATGKVIIAAGAGVKAGDMGGSSKVTLSAENLPEHAHAYADTVPDVTNGKGGILSGIVQVLTGVSPKTMDKTTKTTGAGKAVEIPMPPFLALNGFIFGG